MFTWLHNLGIKLIYFDLFIILVHTIYFFFISKNKKKKFNEFAMNILVCVISLIFFVFIIIIF